MILILYNIRSVYNVASIFRTADGAGVSKVFLIGITPTPLDKLGNFRKDFQKVALGAERMVKWEYVKSFTAVYKKLRKSAGGRIKILAVEQDKRAIPYYEFKAQNEKLKVKNEKRKTENKKKEIALVFGEETKGLTKSVLDKVDKILEIPMQGIKESLNVSVAVGVVVYHMNM